MEELTLHEIKKYVVELINTYPDLKLISQNEKELIVSGTIHVNRCLDNFTVLKDWPIEIHIPTSTESLPYVVDVEDTIDSNYPHRYSDGKLCQATDFDQRIQFAELLSLSQWMEKFVEPYLVIHEYYQRYSEFPYGDREHGSIGILQAYQDFFNADTLATLRLLSYINQHIYRGHVPCPCESGNKLRNCHGSKLQYIYSSPMLLSQARADFQCIREDYKKCISQQAKRS